MIPYFPSNPIPILEEQIPKKNIIFSSSTTIAKSQCQTRNSTRRNRNGRNNSQTPKPNKSNNKTQHSPGMAKGNSQNIFNTNNNKPNSRNNLGSIKNFTNHGKGGKKTRVGNGYSKALANNQNMLNSADPPSPPTVTSLSKKLERRRRSRSQKKRVEVSFQKPPKIGSNLNNLNLKGFPPSAPSKSKSRVKRKSTKKKRVKASKENLEGLQGHGIGKRRASRSVKRKKQKRLSREVRREIVKMDSEVRAAVKVVNSLQVFGTEIHKKRSKKNKL